MDPKPILAIVITIAVLIFGVVLFSDNLHIKILDGKGFTKTVTEARRNIPVEASLNTIDAYSLSFDTSSNTQDVIFSISSDSPITINNQNIKSKANSSTVRISNFSGKINLANGSATLSGKGNNIQFGDYEFSDESSISMQGKLVKVSLNSVQGDFSFSKVSGNFNVVANQSKQKFNVNSENVDVKNFLGSIEIVHGLGETVTMNGLVSKIVTPEFTISKDY